MSCKKSIAIMGGTFDPIHLGHIDMALHCKEKYGLDEVVFIPTGDPPHKVGRDSTKYHRYEMTKLAVEGYAGFGVSDIEVLRDGKTYTFDTLTQLQEIYNDYDFYYIIGADTLKELHTWYRVHDVVKMTGFIVVGRTGIDGSKFKHLISEVKRDLGANIIDAQYMGLDISSTQVREYAKNGNDLTRLVPQEVLEYIVKNELYV